MHARKKTRPDIPDKPSALGFSEHPLLSLIRGLPSFPVLSPGIPRGRCLVTTGNLLFINVDLFASDDPDDPEARFEIFASLGDEVFQTAVSGLPGVPKRKVRASGLKRALARLCSIDVKDLVSEGLGADEPCSSREEVERTLLAWDAIRTDDRASLDALGPVGGRRVPWNTDPLMLAISCGSPECCKSLVESLRPSSLELARRWASRPRICVLPAIVDSHKRPLTFLRSSRILMEKAMASIPDPSVVRSLVGADPDALRTALDAQILRVSTGRGSGRKSRKPPPAQGL